ncbi:MAG: efflux RND transporter periplasmic adaptor subunit [Bacillota bacterium]
MKKKKRFIWMVVALLSVITVISVTLSGKSVEVDTIQVVKGDLDKYVEEIATVRMEDQILLTATTAGRIREVLKKAGDKVNAGEVLAKLDDQEVFLQIQALEAQKQSAEAELAEARNPAGKEEIEMLKAQVKAAEVSYNAAKREADNNKTLYESGAVSLDVYQSSLTRLAGEESNLEAAKSRLTLAQKGASSNVRKQLEGQINRIQAEIDLLKKQSNDLSIKAPMDGVVLDVKVMMDSFVQPGSPLFEIGRDEALFLESDILVEEVGDIKVGADVIIENEDLNIKEIRGTVRKVHPKAFSKISDLGIEQKRVKVEIDFKDNIDSNDDTKTLKPGYDMDIKVIIESRKDILFIDENALFEYQGKDYVFVVENGQARLRKIEKGIESDEKIEVIKGLKEGEEVILSPDETIEDGLKIK